MTITKDAVVDAVLRGIATANVRLEDWSRGAWVTDYGVEGFMVAQIAAALRKAQDERESLVIEAPFDDLREYSGAARPPGRPRKVLQGSRRADIALFDRRGRTVHVIEVKRKWEKGRCFEDIERLLALLNACARQKDGSLKYGFLALPIVEWASTWREVKEKVDAKVDGIHQDIGGSFGIERRAMQSRRGRLRRYPERYGACGEWAAAAFCVAFSARAAGGTLAST